MYERSVEAKASWTSALDCIAGGIFGGGKGAAGGKGRGGPSKQGWSNSVLSCVDLQNMC